MGDLEIFSLPLGNIKLERINVNDKNHIRALKKLRDKSAREMCYDVKQDIVRGREGRLVGNPFLVKGDQNYVGYVFISDDHDNERVLSYIVQKRLRGKGLGKVILTEVSDYLLDNRIASAVSLWVKRKNIAGTQLALSCGFEKSDSSVTGKSDLYSRKR